MVFKNYYFNIILGETVLPSDDDVVVITATKPKPRINKTQPWDGVVPNFS